jgi:ribosomal protein S18 acetylase RimI-like enzyme
MMAGPTAVRPFSLEVIPMAWYSEPKPVPPALDTADLHLEMLAPQHVDIDHAAFMSSRERLLAWSGGRWPHEGFTRDENMADMVMHRDEFLAREAFAYTVLSAAQDRCEGCIYINPLARSLSVDAEEIGGELPESTARVTWWVRDDALPRNLDRQLIAGLVNWFRTDWQFDAVTFLTRADNAHDIALLESAGLTRTATLSDQNGPGEFSLYRLEQPSSP